MSQQSIAVILWLNTGQVKFDSEIIYWNKDITPLQGPRRPAPVGRRPFVDRYIQATGNNENAFQMIIIIVCRAFSRLFPSTVGNLPYMTKAAVVSAGLFTLFQTTRYCVRSIFLKVFRFWCEQACPPPIEDSGCPSKPRRKKAPNQSGLQIVGLAVSFFHSVRKSRLSMDQWNCSSSVEPVSAVTDEAPPWITVVMSSK